MNLFIGDELICNGNRLYMLYSADNQYHLASLDLNGEDYKTHIIFDYEPQKVIVNNGKIYIYHTDFNANQDYIEIYDHRFKLIETKIYDGAQSTFNFYIENDEIIIPNDFVIYKNENIKIAYAIENIESDEKRKVVSHIQIGDDKFTFENKFVLYVNDEYFYTSSCTYPQIYERYHLNGELDKSIVINEHIKSVFPTKHLFENDFSYILKLRDKDIAYGHSGSMIFEVDFNKGTCHYLGL